MKRILIIGAGGLGKEVVDLVKAMGGYEIVGFLDDNIEIKGTSINHVPVLDTTGYLDQYQGVDNVAIAIANPKIKKKIYERIMRIGFKYPNLVHPTAMMGSNVKLGVGNIIGANSILSTEVTLQDFVTVNPQCGIGHESELRSFTTLYWNVNISGNVTVQEGCELGSKSCVLQGLNITRHAIIGAGAVVVKDIHESGTYIGVPAGKIK